MIVCLSKEQRSSRKEVIKNQGSFSPRYAFLRAVIINDGIIYGADEKNSHLLIPFWLADRRSDGLEYAEM
jgi:hypothetical protein